MPYVVQVTGAGIERGHPGALTRARDAFRHQHAVRLPALFPAALLSQLLPYVRRATFAPRVHDRLHRPATDAWIPDPAVAARFGFALNHPRLFDVIRDITDCDPIASFHALIYTLRAGAGHADHWHDDLDGNRLVGLSVNLGDEPYQGGVFQIRDRETEAVLHSEHNTGAGDALLFRIADGFQHRVSDVTGPAPRLTLAGWFQRSPDYVGLLRGPD